MAKFKKSNKLKNSPPPTSLSSNQQHTSKFIEFYRNINKSLLEDYKTNMTESQLLIEHLLLKDLSNQKEHDLNLLYFIINELLDLPFTNKKTPLNKFNKLIHTVLDILDKKRDSKFILFRLKILEKLSKNGLYVPIFGFYVDIVEQIIQSDGLINKNEVIKKDLDFGNRVKIDQQILQSTAFCEYAINTSLKGLLNYLNKFSTSISFPEIIKPIIQNLIKFKDLESVKTTIHEISKHSKYIENNRTAIETLSANDRKIFEKKVKPMNIL